MWLQRQSPAEAWEWQELLPWAWAAEPDPSPGSAPALSRTQARALGGRAQLHALNAAKSLQIQRDSRLDSSQDLPRVTPFLSPKRHQLCLCPRPKGTGPCHLIPVPSLSAVPSPAVSASAASSDPAVVAASSLSGNPTPAPVFPRGRRSQGKRRAPLAGLRAGWMRSSGALQKSSCAAHIPREPLVPSILPAQLRARGCTRWPGPPPPPGPVPPCRCPSRDTGNSETTTGDPPPLRPRCLPSTTSGSRGPTGTEREPRSERTPQPGPASRRHCRASERPPAPGAAAPAVPARGCGARPPPPAAAAPPAPPHRPPAAAAPGSCASLPRSWWPRPCSVPPLQPRHPQTPGPRPGRPLGSDVTSGPPRGALPGR